jgi:hypothetical protein
LPIVCRREFYLSAGVPDINVEVFYLSVEVRSWENGVK